MLVCEVDSGVCGCWGCLWYCYLFFCGEILGLPLEVLGRPWQGGVDGG